MISATTITFSNSFGEAIAPFLVLLREHKFFEASVFIPVMTTLAALIFCFLQRRLKEDEAFSSPIRIRLMWLWYSAYFSLCFLATNSVAVAFKTLIVEETDYKTVEWFIGLVSPLHFYIASVALAHIALVWRQSGRTIDYILWFYSQIGLSGGYLIAIRRVLSEPWVLSEPTSGIGGFYLFLWFLLLHWDLVLRTPSFPCMAEPDSSRRSRNPLFSCGDVGRTTDH